MHEQATYPHLSYPVLWAHMRGCALILSLGVAIPYASQLYSTGTRNPMFWECIGLAVLTTIVATVCGALWGVIVGICMAIRVYLSGTLPLWLSVSTGFALRLALFLALSHMRGPLSQALLRPALERSGYMSWYWLALPIVATLGSRWRLRWAGTLRT